MPFNSAERVLIIQGSPDGVLSALEQVVERLQRAKKGTSPSSASGATSGDLPTFEEDSWKDLETVVKWVVPQAVCGALIGKSGKGIKKINMESGAWVKVAHTEEYSPETNERYIPCVHPGLGWAGCFLFNTLIFLILISIYLSPLFPSCFSFLLFYSFSGWCIFVVHLSNVQSPCSISPLPSEVGRTPILQRPTLTQTPLPSLPPPLPPPPLHHPSSLFKPFQPSWDETCTVLCSLWRAI